MGGGPVGDAEARVEQAAEMIARQLECAMDEARARLRILAESHGQSLEHTALDVLDGIIRFDP